MLPCHTLHADGEHSPPCAAAVQRTHWPPPLRQAQQDVPLPAAVPCSGLLPGERPCMAAVVSTVQMLPCSMLCLQGTYETSPWLACCTYFLQPTPSMLCLQVDTEEDVLWTPDVREAPEEIKQRGMQFIQWLMQRPEQHIAVVSTVELMTVDCAGQGSSGTSVATACYEPVHSEHWEASHQCHSLSAQTW